MPGRICRTALPYRLEDKEEFAMYIDCYNVILRAPEAEDLPLLQRMINDPAIERMTVGGVRYLRIGRNGGLTGTISRKNCAACFR